MRSKTIKPKKRYLKKNFNKRLITGKLKFRDLSVFEEDVHLFPEDHAILNDELMESCIEQDIDEQDFDMISSFVFNISIPVHLDGNLGNNNIDNLVLMLPEQALRFYKENFENFSNYTQEQLGIYKDGYCACCGEKLETDEENDMTPQNSVDKSAQKSDNTNIENGLNLGSLNINDLKDNAKYWKN